MRIELSFRDSEGVGKFFAFLRLSPGASNLDKCDEFTKAGQLYILNFDMTMNSHSVL
jgi:hypothetical protein